MKKTAIYVLSGLALVASLVSCGNNTVKGEKGEDGAPGLNGSDGEKGADGNSILTGNGVPSSDLGSVGDSYIDLSSYNYYVKSDNGWEMKGNIKGETGAYVVETKIDDDGHLKITLSNGDVYDAGQVKDTTKHKVNFIVDGIVAKTIDVPNGGKITRPADSDFPGYTITSWNVNEDGGYRWLYSVYTVTSDIDLYAVFAKNSYTITIKESKFGLGDKFYTLKYKDKYDFSSAYAKDGYSFSLLDEEGSTYPLSGVYGDAKDMVLNVKWEGLSHILTLASNDISMGSGNISKGVTRYNEEITVTASPTDGNAFYGWYKGDELLTYESKYTFTMPNDDLTLTAKFVTQEEYDKIVKFAMRPTFDENKEYITYGVYPQSHVNDKETLEALKGKDLMMWLVEYNGDYYARATAAPYNDETTYTYSDGLTIKKNSTDWFKLEPIKWRVLETLSDGTCVLYSDMILDLGQYSDETTNDYYSSVLRSKLKGDFKNIAFNFNSDFLRNYDVDVTPTNTNSEAKSSSDHKACSDNVFVLSQVDYRFGETISGHEAAVTSDYARALGAYTNSSGKGNYWSSTPLRDTGDKALSITDSGSLSSASVSDYKGIRPSIAVKIPD